MITPRDSPSRRVIQLSCFVRHCPTQRGIFARCPLWLSLSKAEQANLDSGIREIKNDRPEPRF